MTKRTSILLFLLFCSTAVFSQSKEVLKEQNEKLKIMFNELRVEKELLEKKKRELAVKAKLLDKEYQRKLADLDSTKRVVVDKENEIYTKDKSLSTLTEQKEYSELLLDKQETEKRLLIVGIGFIALLAGVIFYFWVIKKRAGDILEDEKRKSDTLLLNILPLEIAEELKNTSKTPARSYDLATVLFADIKDFTKISARMSPEVLIQELEYMFGAFDHIIHKYNIEKIKIIGDCYMCVGGIPKSNDTNPMDTVNAAIEIQAFMAKMKAERIAKKKQVYEVRIGINSGPIIAGVIGSKKFAYDVWGDTVNLASRIENSSEPGKVNISQYTYERIKSHFPCIHRGKIDAKGKGAVDMYFVTGHTIPIGSYRDKPVEV